MREFKNDDVNSFIEEISSLWDHTYGTLIHRFDKERGFVLELHTGGWSENEDIIEELIDNFFWAMYWQKSERGGHFYFGR